MDGKAKRQKTLYAKVTNILCLVMLIGTFAGLIFFWNQIPDQIPGHFDGAGNIDRWGDKSELWITPVMSLILYAGISVLENFPGVWNTGVKVTPENHDRVYGTLQNMISTEKLVMVSLFTCVTASSAFVMPLPVWFLPVTLLLTFGTIAVSLIRLYRAQ